MSPRFRALACLLQRDSKGDEHEGPSKRFEVEADSASEARSQIEAEAKSLWRTSARKRIDVGPAYPVEKAPQTWYAFVFEEEYGHLEQSATGRRGASFQVRGTLYDFDSRTFRDEFIKERVPLVEYARVVTAKKLPKGWGRDHAWHLELSEDSKHWLRFSISHLGKPDILPRDTRW